MRRACVGRIGRDLLPGPADQLSGRVASVQWDVRALRLGVLAGAGFVPEPQAFVPVARAAVLRVPAKQPPARRSLRPASPASAKARARVVCRPFSARIAPRRLSRAGDSA